jgi:hypothetical protein
MRIAQMVAAATSASRNLAIGFNLGALRFASKPMQMAQYTSEAIFLAKALARRRGLPERNVAEVLPLPNSQQIELAGLRQLAWNQPVGSYLIDLVSLCLICRAIQPRVVFEIGTSVGYTALHFALNTDADARVFTLDLPRLNRTQPVLVTTLMDEMHIRGNDHIETYCFDGESAARKITCLLGDSAAFDFSPWHDGVDLFFIDGAHSYEYVRSDTTNALSCARQGSVIAWHDFGRAGVNGVTRVLTELTKAGRVIYAVPGGSLAYMVVG